MFNGQLLFWPYFPQLKPTLILVTLGQIKKKLKVTKEKYKAGWWQTRMDLGQNRQDVRKHMAQTQTHQERDKETKRCVTSALCWKSVVVLAALPLLIFIQLKFGYIMQIRSVQWNISLSCFHNRVWGSFQTSHHVGPNESSQSTRVQSWKALRGLLWDEPPVEVYQ